MKLNVQNPHLSITRTAEYAVANFTVLTGLNGSGKTHLLQGIKQGNIVCDDIPVQGVTLVTLDSIKKDDGAKPNIDTACRQFLSGKENGNVNWNSSIRKLFRKYFTQANGAEDIMLLEPFKEKLNKPFWSLNVEEFPNHIQEAIRGFRQAMEDEVFGNTSFLEFPYHRNIIESYKTHAIIRNGTTLTCDQFLGSIGGDFQLGQISKIYQEYDKKKEEYALDQFKYHNRSESFNNLKEEYEQRNPKPWDLLDEVLDEVRGYFPDGRVFNFRITNPEKDPISDISKFSASLRTKGVSVGIPPNNLSSGEQVILMLITLAFESRNRFVPPALLLLDEIDATLHPSMIKTMYRIIENVFINRGSKVILATHSPTTISLADPSSLYVIYHGDHQPKIEPKSKKEALSVLTEGYMTIEELLTFNSIDYANVIVSEGKNYNYLAKAKEYFDNDDQIGILEMDIGGSSQLRTLFNLLKHMNLSKRFFLVWDCDYWQREQRNREDQRILKDDAGNTLYEDRPTNFLNEGGENCRGYIFSKNENSRSERGIENLFNTEDLEHYSGEFKLNGSGPNKKSSHERFILENSSQEVFTNFQPLFDFVQENLLNTDDQ